MTPRDAAVSASSGGPGRAAASSTWPEWVGVALLALGGLACGLLEVLLVPLTVGSTPAPVAVLCALVSNVALPVLAYLIKPNMFAAALPFAGWLIVVFVAALVTRPEGDVILPGSPSSMVYIAYAVILCGALAGAITLVALSNGGRLTGPRVLSGGGKRPAAASGGAGRRTSATPVASAARDAAVAGAASPGRNAGSGGEAGSGRGAGSDGSARQGSNAGRDAAAGMRPPRPSSRGRKRR